MLSPPSPTGQAALARTPPSPASLGIARVSPRPSSVHNSPKACSSVTSGATSRRTSVAADDDSRRSSMLSAPNKRRTSTPSSNAESNVVMFPKVSDDVRRASASSTASSRRSSAAARPCSHSLSDPPIAPPTVNGDGNRGDNNNDSNGSKSVAQDDALPWLGSALRPDGYTLIEVDAKQRTAWVFERLTDVFVYDRIRRGGFQPTLYLYAPEQGALFNESASMFKALERFVKSVEVGQKVVLQAYSHPDPVKGMLDQVKAALGMAADVEFKILTPELPSGRPRPMDYSTAANLGFCDAQDVPELMESVISDRESTAAARRWLEKHLLLPSSHEGDAAVRKICEFLWTYKVSLPKFDASLDPEVVACKLADTEPKNGSLDCSDSFFRKLYEAVGKVAAACSKEGLESFSEAVLTVVAAETGVWLSREQMVQCCAAVQKAIDEVIDDGSGAAVPATTGIEGRPELAAALQLLAANKKHEGKVRLEKVQSEMAAVKAAEMAMVDAAERAQLQAKEKMLVVMAEAVEKKNRATARVGRLALRAAAMIKRTGLLPISETIIDVPASKSLAAAAPAADGTGKGVALPVLEYDEGDDSCWIRMPRGVGDRFPEIFELHPGDSGTTHTALYTTAKLKEAQADYRIACSELDKAVRKALLLLAESLGPVLHQVKAAVTFAVVGKALYAHVCEAHRMGWALPRLSNDPAASFAVDGMWPYWKGGPGGLDPGTVRNSFQMDGMFLLRDNPAVVRSTNALAALVRRGLAVPAAASTTVPPFDAVVLRSSRFVADSPVEGLVEVENGVNKAAQRSLVLIEELDECSDAGASAEFAAAATDGETGSGLSTETDCAQQSDGGGAGPGDHTLDDAVKLLKTTAAEVLRGLNLPVDDSTLEVWCVHPGEVAPPSMVGKPCVYVARRQDGWFYVGFSGDVQKRINVHRQPNVDSKINDPIAVFAYMLVSHSDAAKSIERNCIMAMKGKGMRLLSNYDARRRVAPNRN